MKTYAKKQGEKPFDWNKFLARMLERSRLDLTEAQQNNDYSRWEDAVELSGDWVTCACGNQCAIIPRDDEGCPEDEALAEIGRDFHNAVCDHDAKRAIRILESIEKRSCKIINRMYKEIKEAAANC